MLTCFKFVNEGLCKQVSEKHKKVDNLSDWEEDGSNDDVQDNETETFQGGCKRVLFEYRDEKSNGEDHVGNGQEHQVADAEGSPDDAHKR